MASKWAAARAGGWPGEFQPAGRPDRRRRRDGGGGLSGAGIFTQSGGTNAVVGGGDSPQDIAFFNTKNFYSSYYAASLGWDGHNTHTATGTYTLSGTGLLGASGEMMIGVNGMGTFNQTGGTNLASGLFGVGDNNGEMGVYYGGGKGFYNLSGGYLRPSESQVTLTTRISVSMETGTGLRPVLRDGSFHPNGRHQQRGRH